MFAEVWQRAQETAAHPATTSLNHTEEMGFQHLPHSHLCHLKLQHISVVKRTSCSGINCIFLLPSTLLLPLLFFFLCFVCVCVVFLFVFKVERKKKKKNTWINVWDGFCNLFANRHTTFQKPHKVHRGWFTKSPVLWDLIKPLIFL